MNQTQLTGRATKGVELRFIPNSGTAVARFSIAVNRDFKKEGQPEADFFNVVVWGKSAEFVANNLKKGKLCSVVGSLRNNNYEDKNGVKHYNVEINANRVEVLEWGDKPQQSMQQQTKDEFDTSKQEDFSGFTTDMDSDLPF